MLAQVFGTIAGAHSKRTWGVIALALSILLLGVPAANLLVPEGAFLHVPDFGVALLGKFLCFAIVALAIDMIWGYTGILSLGHGHMGGHPAIRSPDGGPSVRGVHVRW